MSETPWMYLSDRGDEGWHVEDIMRPVNPQRCRVLFNTGDEATAEWVYIVAKGRCEIRSISLRVNNPEIQREWAALTDSALHMVAWKPLENAMAEEVSDG